MTALVAWNPRRRRTLWLDADTGHGVDDDGRPCVDNLRDRHELLAGYKRAPAVKLSEVLRLAELHRVERVMLTGARTPPGWLLTRTPPDWTPGAHHLDHETPVGRYRHEVAGVTVEVRRAAEWFGAGDYTPADARTAWELLGARLAAAVPGAALLSSPGATGREAWLRSMPRGAEPPPVLDLETAELIRSTSGQHRVERFPAPAGVDTMPGLWLLDGRLMYAACVRELGGGPVTRLGAGAHEHMSHHPYARARYQVRVTVPDWWELAGVLPLAGDDPADGWSYPAEPGRTFTTWADAAEVALALEGGWTVQALDGLLFTPGRPLDTWAARLLRAHDTTDPHTPAHLARMVRAGVRWMLLHSIGAWHSSGRTETTVTDSAMQRPHGAGWGAPEPNGRRAIWRRRVPLDGRAALMAHPEWSAQVWGRARARVADAPTSAGPRGMRAGALNVHRAELVSVYGDAVMTTTRPDWAAPEYDDGKVGRLRVKGHLHGPIPWPASSSARDALMHDAERNGARCPDCESE